MYLPYARPYVGLFSPSPISSAALGLAPEERVHEAVLITGDNEDEADDDEAKAEQAEAELLQRLHNLQLKSNSTAARKSDSSAGLEEAAAADVEPQATLPVVAPVDESQEG